MIDDSAALYMAYLSRDPRFDGVFYIGVTSTGIYCRPVCTAKTPKEANCRFFNSAEEAEKASFRPCLRCRPELAPGNAPVDDAHRIANLIAYRLEAYRIEAAGMAVGRVERVCAAASNTQADRCDDSSIHDGSVGDGSVGDGIIEEAYLDGETGLEAIAAQFNLSSRQIRRIIRRELGVSPIELLLTRRLLLAKQLLTETSLPIIDVAFASGFSSLRRFNDAFSGRYRMPPSRLRKEAAVTHMPDAAETLTLQLTYRPPFDWPGIMQFLSTRTLKGVERVVEDEYFRTVQLGGCKGWIHVRHTPEKRALLIEFSQSLTPVLPALLGSLRNIFDLSARPDIISAHLMQDRLLTDAVARNPGMRVPGAFDGFEMAVRAILGQQITVKAATTIAGRFVEAFGEKFETPHSALSRLCPTPRRIAALKVEDLAALGIIRTRAASIIAMAHEVASGRLKLEAGAHPDLTIKQLVALPGIGAWTAHYIAMRALRWPDAFPKEDIVLRNRLGGVSAARAEELSQAWRPWRGYAVLHLWRNPQTADTIAGSDGAGQV